MLTAELRLAKPVALAPPREQPAMADDKAKPAAATQQPAPPKEAEEKKVDTGAQESAAKEREKTGGYQ
jgi:hypothetical protein